MLGLRLVADGVERDVAEGTSFTFGRSGSCDLPFDGSDTSVSRVAGTLAWEGGAWWLTNSSATRQLAVVDEIGFRSVVVPGRRVAVEGRLRVLVEGAKRTYELVLEAPRSDGGAVRESAEEPTSIGAEVVLRAEDRAALVALFSGYLEEGERYDPNPKSYAAAAARLGWPRTTLVKRVEYLRTRLGNAGVPGMQGWNALSALAEHVLSAGVITKADLRILPR